MQDVRESGSKPDTAPAMYLNPSATFGVDPARKHGCQPMQRRDLSKGAKTATAISIQPTFGSISLMGITRKKNP